MRDSTPIVDRADFFCQRPDNMYNETSIWFEWGAATQSNGESLVRIQHCPATVIASLAGIDKVRTPRQKLHLVRLTYEVLGEPTTLFVCLYHLR